MDDQRDYAEEAAVRRDIEREGEQELAAERDEQLIDAIRATIAAGRDRGDSSSAILGQVESLLAGVETFAAAARPVADRHVRLAASSEERDGDDLRAGPKPVHVEGLAHPVRGGAWHTQPSGEQPTINPARRAGA